MTRAPPFCSLLRDPQQIDLSLSQSLQLILIQGDFDYTRRVRVAVPPPAWLCLHANHDLLNPRCTVGAAQGIGSNFVDGEPNIKYLPQRPVELHEISASPPPAPLSPKATIRRRLAPPAGEVSSLSGRPKSAASATGGTTHSTATTAGGKEQAPSPKVRQVRLSTTKEGAENREALGQQPCPPAATTSTAGFRGRPHSSPAMRGGPSPRNTEGGVMDAPKNQPPIRFPARNKAVSGPSLRGGSAHVEKNKPEKPRLRRPQTADGRDIEIMRHKTPFLDDPADPVMIAHRCVPTTVALTMQSKANFV